MADFNAKAEQKPPSSTTPSTDASNSPRTGRAAPTPPPSPPAPPRASVTDDAILQQCLKLLKGSSDEHKFAGLVMVTKHVPALTTRSGHGREQEQLRQICDAVGMAFVHRLLKTTGDASTGRGGQTGAGGTKGMPSVGGGDSGGGGAGLSLYQQIALGVLSAFVQDESLVLRFVPVAPALVRALRGVSATTEIQALCDALACTQAIAGAPGGMERLLRAGAAPAVAIRLVAASKARVLVAEAVTARGVNGSTDRATAESKGSGTSDGATNGNEKAHHVQTGVKTVQKLDEAEGASATTPDAAAAAVAAAEPRETTLDTEPKALELAARAEYLAFAFLGRALEASEGECLGRRELTAIAEAFRDDPTPAKFAFMDLLLRWAALQEDGGSLALAQAESDPEQGRGGSALPLDKEDSKVEIGTLGVGGHVVSPLGGWTKQGMFPAALREGLLQALHGAANDERRDSALALLASLLRTLGQEWAVEEDEDGESRERTDNTGRKTSAKRKRGTFVAFALRIACGEVRILLDESLSLLLPKAVEAASRGGVRAGGPRQGAETEPGANGKARGPMGPAGVDPDTELAAELAAKRTAETDRAAANGGGAEERKDGGRNGSAAVGKGALLPPREPLSPRELRVIKEERTTRLIRMLPVSLGVVDSTVAFLCGGGGGSGEEVNEDEGDNEVGGASGGRWEKLPIYTLQDLQKTLVGLFGCVLDFMSELKPWIVPGARAGGTPAGAVSPSLPDLWTLRRLGLDCSRALGMWMAEDPESLPQRFLENLPALLALNARPEPPDSDDEDSDDEREEIRMPSTPAAALRAFPRAAGRLAVPLLNSSEASFQGNESENALVDEALYNILRAMLALSYEPAPLAAMVEEGVTARMAGLAAAGGPAIAALLFMLTNVADKQTPPGPPYLAEQSAEMLRSPLVTACGLLTNILSSAGHLPWPEDSFSDSSGATAAVTGQPRPSTHPVLAHPEMGECLASLAEIAGLAGAARRKPIRGGARWRLLAAHATLVVLTVARAATPDTGLAPSRKLAARKTRWNGVDFSTASAEYWQAQSQHNVAGRAGDNSGTTVWDAMACAVDEALGSLSPAPGRGLIGGRGDDDDEEASYEEGAIWQWCLECARAIEAAPGGSRGNSYVASGVVPRWVLKSLAEASSDGRI